MESDEEVPELAPELAKGFDTSLVATGVETERVAVEAVACDPLLVELPVAVADPDVEDELDESELSSDSSEVVMNGLELLPPVPAVKSSVNTVSELCLEMEASTLSLFRGSPLLEA